MPTNKFYDASLLDEEDKIADGDEEEDEEELAIRANRKTKKVRGHWEEESMEEE